mmetsp:Transcript_348/g.508  ORF Transcript_348/g.508 Transcript_348/m.508 type:complete len:142 (-) Transcript_348:162-587(-)|eukprot:CAMPEP_0118674550 /NCGR_PEP_ID=MMETSP0800-20121206/951_1 /TAXON_ID=210618 ORGANISM="Striatella unipunctata, Strain CCMP2910" /NCGR_SAMPLE_ID=MMETSP0800 /ASSEMBLY_ACC=CAM_ASM_000638 /LENGTH=141 /DNA_ID=CAMNT_0006569759 /DNA_START=60 /DNA_END=485 /DNA_ORIENTATION=+
MSESTPLVSTEQKYNASFVVKFVAISFALATLVTGMVAVFLNTGPSLLVDANIYQSDDNDFAVVVAPNLRAWGARQVGTGVPLWCAIFMGADNKGMYQVGFIGMMVRQVLDIVVETFKERYYLYPAYIGAFSICAFALYNV